MPKKYWLLKSEPSVYSIDDMERDKKTYWDGVRNYQARNFLRDKIKTGDLAFFYHSNAEPSGVAGVIEVTREGYPDPSAWDREDKHYDPKTKPDQPIWYVIDVRFVEKFDQIVPLNRIRETGGLERMPLLRRGQRLSVQPVAPGEWRLVMGLARKTAQFSS